MDFSAGIDHADTDALLEILARLWLDILHWTVNY
jgi:hypothetical protein